MRCHDPSEQIFQLKDRLIAIDWGMENGDKSVKTTVKLGSDGSYTVVEMKELKKSEPIETEMRGFKWQM